MDGLASENWGEFFLWLGILVKKTPNFQKARSFGVLYKITCLFFTTSRIRVWVSKTLSLG